MEKEKSVKKGGEGMKALIKKLKELFFPSGSVVISGAFTGFQKTVTKLQEGIELCKKEAIGHTETIDKAEADRKEAYANIDKAQAFVNNLQKLMAV